MTVGRPINKKGGKGFAALEVRRFLQGRVYHKMKKKQV
jgi:hypothetical protein